MEVGNLYTVARTYGFNNESDPFILTRFEIKPPTKGENREPLPIGFFLNLKTGEKLKINHPQSVFVPVATLDSNDKSETQKKSLP